MKERGQMGESGTTGHLLWGFLPSSEQARLEALLTQEFITGRGLSKAVCDGGIHFWRGLNTHV